MKYDELLHIVMEHVGSHGMITQNLDQLNSAEFSKERFALISCKAENHNQLKMAEQQLRVDIDVRIIWM